MRNAILFIVSVAAGLLSGCGTTQPAIPPSPAEKSTGFTYIPLDPLPVVVVDTGPGCERRLQNGNYDLLPGYRAKELLDSLPDNAVRLAVKEYDMTGKLSYGIASIGEQQKRYQVILDYINVDTTNMPFFIEDGEVARADGFVMQDDLKTLSAEQQRRKMGNTVVPVYVGVGLRLTADLQVLRGRISLSSLPSIAASVEAGNASGSLVVQTLGVTGKQVSTSLPLPSELNQTTVQNTILSLGSIKAIIYDKNSAVVTPRVTGIYLPLANASETLVNRIVSELARKPIQWDRPCEKGKEVAGGA